MSELDDAYNKLTPKQKQQLRKKLDAMAAGIDKGVDDKELSLVSKPDALRPQETGDEQEEKPARRQLSKLQIPEASVAPPSVKSGPGPRSGVVMPQRRSSPQRLYRKQRAAAMYQRDLYAKAQKMANEGIPQGGSRKRGNAAGGVTTMEGSQARKVRELAEKMREARDGQKKQGDDKPNPQQMKALMEVIKAANKEMLKELDGQIEKRMKEMKIDERFKEMETVIGKLPQAIADLLVV